MLIQVLDDSDELDAQLLIKAEDRNGNKGVCIYCIGTVLYAQATRLGT